MNYAANLTTVIRATTPGFVVSAITLACIGATVTGCSQGDMKADRNERSSARTLRNVEANHLDRAAAERDTNTPVPRLFVNGDVIEVDDVLRPIRGELAESAESLPPGNYRQVLHDKIIQEFREQARALLLYQEAAKRLSEREEEFLAGLVDDEVRKRVNTGFGGRQSRYEKALAEQGLTLTEERERIRREMIVMRHLHQTVTSRVLDPTRAELVRFFDERKADLTQPERRKMSLIEVPRAAGVSAPGASHDADPSTARDLIARAKAELDAGADFAAVAAAYSKGIHAEEGGAWDPLPQGSVKAHWEPAVARLFRMQIGEISEIIETNEAYFIVRCDAIDPAVEPDFEAMQPRLMQAYRDVQFNRLVDERVRELQQKAVFVPENVGRFLQAAADAAAQPTEP